MRNDFFFLNLVVKLTAVVVDLSEFEICETMKINRSHVPHAIRPTNLFKNTLEGIFKLN